jgi:hypothetical protein
MLGVNPKTHAPVARVDTGVDAYSGVTFFLALIPDKMP